MEKITLEAQFKPFVFLILFVCFLSLNIIYSKTSENIGNKREVKAFKGMLISFMLYIFVDLRLLIGDSFYTAFPRLFVLFVMSLGFVSMSFSCFFWFLHVYAALPQKNKRHSNSRLSVRGVLINIPILVCVIILFTPLRVIAYDIKDGLPVFSAGLPFIILMDYIYLIAATCISIHNRKLAKTRHEKKKYSSQVIFILFFTISGYLIAFLLNLPAIELCVIPVVLKLFVELQDSQIYTDALTKLYNRRRMTDFINEEISTCSEENPLTIIMIDLDYFKSINDILGHDEGDKALITVSRAIKKALISQNAVAARWGGDEFVVAGKDPELYENFRSMLSDSISVTSKLSYTPQFSAGFYKCTSPDITCDQALIQADSELYNDKKERHKNSSDFIKKLEELSKNHF